MPQLDEKLMHFTQVLMEEADAESAAVEAEIAAARAKARSEAEDEILQDAYRYIKSEVSRLRTESGRQVSRQMQENQRRLSLRREEMAREVFAVVREKLDAYTKTDAYPRRLTVLFREALSLLGTVKSVTVYLRPEDRTYLPLLQKAAGPVKVTAETGTFQLGGLVLLAPEKARRVDATFDTALDELSGHFAELIGLRLAR